jgi:hypothetical protein
MRSKRCAVAFGAQELAAAVGVERANVSMWLAHDHYEIPQPDIRLACGPVWFDSPALRAWLKTTRVKVRARRRRRAMLAMKRAQAAADL